MSDSDNFTAGPWGHQGVNVFEILGGYRLVTAQTEDDARLIAAAPCLLAALRESLELIEFFHGTAGWSEYQASPEMVRIRAAIAKAVG
jgi:hypothetical protein